MWGTDQNGVGLANGPEINLVIFSSGDKNPARLPPNLKAVYTLRMSYEFL